MVAAEDFKKLKNRILNIETSHTNLKKKYEKLLKITKMAVEDAETLRKEHNFLRSKLNCTNYHCDSIEQYGRKENTDYNEVDEKENETQKDVMDAVIDRANYALSQSEHYKNIRVEPSDIQRVHRLGKVKESEDGLTKPKPRKIICRFKSYQLRQKIMFSKRNLKKHPVYKNSFITENLTPFRSKLLWYVKKKCDGKFVKVHTRDGNIKAQLREAQEKDDKWYTIQTPDDLFKFGVDIDFKLLNENYFRFEVYEELKPTSTFNQFEELINSTDENSV